MRRLADELSERARTLRRHDGQLDVIGVVGSDTYDKLVVLQALRERFPQAIFFTTDLDARLFHPADFRWNHNLLVASSFGLELDRGLQDRVPPFRDSYQTATFLAAQMALAEVALGAGTQLPPEDLAPMQPEVRQIALSAGNLKDSPKLPIPVTTIEQLPRLQRLRLAAWASRQGSEALRGSPRLFEIGRGGPYDITPGADPLGLSPPRRTSRPSRNRILGGFEICALASLLLIPVVPGLRRFTLARWSDADARQRFAMNTLTALALVTFVAYAWIVYQATGDPGGEPFELSKGISIWPTEGLRLLVVLLGLSFLALGSAHLKKNDEQLTRDYGLAPSSEPHRDGIWSPWWAARPRREGPAGDAAVSGAASSEGPTYRWLSKRAGSWCRWHLAWNHFRSGISINAWRQQDRQDLDRRAHGDEEPVEAAVAWQRYRRLGRWGHVLTRCVPGVVLYIVLGHTLVAFFGHPHTPFRGDLSLVADLLFLMIVSRASLFDHWNWPLSLLLILGMSSAYAVLCVVVLRRAAERARAETVERLRSNLFAAIEAERREDGPRSRQIRLLIEKAQGLRRGSFAHWSHHPLVKAVLLPFGGIGVLTVLELLASMNP